MPVKIIFRILIPTSAGQKMSYETDSLRRITSASTDNLQLKPNRRPRQNVTSTLRAEQGYDRGHLFGDLFDGSPNLENLVPMEEYVNRSGAFRTLERDWEKAIKSGQKVSVNIKVNYGNTDVPTSFNVECQIGSQDVVTEFIKN